MELENSRVLASITVGAIIMEKPKEKISMKRLISGYLDL